MNQYVYRIQVEGQKRTKTIALYGETEPAVIGHTYAGHCTGADNQRRWIYTVIALEAVRECG